jgi:nucleoside-diphosphate-sugar epimerase
MAARSERILITGGSGFIGAYLARALIAAGHDVHLVLRREANTWRLQGLEGHYTPQWADLRDAAALRRAVHACRPEVIYHLATYGAYPFQKDRAAILATNLLGTANLLDALAGHEYKGMVHVGSSSEYGHKDAPMRETDRLDPRTDYGVSKAAVTLLCQAEAYRGRPIATARVFSAYGPFEEGTRLVPYVLNCCRRGERPRVTSGLAPRDFIYVADVVELIELAAHLPAARGRILNAGGGVRQTVRDMVETILEVCTGGTLTAEYGAAELRPDEPTHWVANMAQTTAITGWKPRYNLRSGIRQTWEWFNAAATVAAA